MTNKETLEIILSDEILSQFINNGKWQKEYINTNNMKKVSHYLKSQGFEAVDCIDFVKNIADMSGKRDTFYKALSEIGYNTNYNKVDSWI